MTMNNRKATGTLTAVTGSASVSIYCSTGNIKQVFIKPVTTSTTFDVTLTDENSNIVLTRTDEQEELNELVDLPCYATYTLSIANASKDEDFKYIIMIQE